MISNTATLSRRCRSAIRSRICAWIVTSSAVVGSSATSSSGSHARAIAISTRWRIPPDISNGYCLTRSAGLAMPTMSSSSTARAHAALRPSLRWRRSTSTIWLPIVNTGSSDVIGSWNTIAISRPRTRSIVAAACGGCTSDSPFQRTSPPTMRPGQLDHPEQRLGGDALARAGLADEAERLALADREADVAHGVHGAAASDEVDLEVVDLEHRFTHRSSPPVGPSAAAEGRRRRSTRRRSASPARPGRRPRAATTPGS